jgi:hypothetical protein
MPAILEETCKRDFPGSKACFESATKNSEAQLFWNHANLRGEGFVLMRQMEWVVLLMVNVRGIDACEQ